MFCDHEDFQEKIREEEDSKKAEEMIREEEAGVQDSKKIKDEIIDFVERIGKASLFAEMKEWISETVGEEIYVRDAVLEKFKKEPLLFFLSYVYNDKIGQDNYGNENLILKIISEARNDYLMAEWENMGEINEDYQVIIMDCLMLPQLHKSTSKIVANLSGVLVPKGMWNHLATLLGEGVSSTNKTRSVGVLSALKETFAILKLNGSAMVETKKFVKLLVPFVFKKWNKFDEDHPLADEIFGEMVSLSCKSKENPGDAPLYLYAPGAASE